MDILQSSSPLNKRKAAFLLTCDRLFKQDDGVRARRVYMWTFTFAKVISDEVAMKCWNHLNVLLTRRYKPTGGCPGVRVVEVHPGGHGLHFHALIARRLDVSEVRKLAIRAGFGRIHVQKCKQSAAAYCAKYLTKKDDGLKKGARRWGMVAGFKGTRVKDIVVESTLAENCRRVRQVVGTWSRELFVAVNRLTVKYGHCLNWPEFPALKAFKPAERSDNDLPEFCEHVIRPVYSFQKLFCSEIKEWCSYLFVEPVEQPF